MVSIPKMEIIGQIMKPLRRSDLLLMYMDMWMRMMMDIRMAIVVMKMMMVSFPNMKIIGWIMKRGAPADVRHIGEDEDDDDGGDYKRIHIASSSWERWRGVQKLMCGS